MRIGIDLGGTKIAGVVLDDNGTTVAKSRIATPSAEGYPAVVDAIGTFVEQLEKEAGVTCSVGIGTPGALSGRTGNMKNCNLTLLNGQPLPQDLKKRLKREIRVCNDANCLALSEAHDGAAKGHRVVFGVIIGTGTGGGVIVDGRAHDGPNSIAGEWGHVPLFHDGPDCYCGKKGCVETMLSGPGMHRDYRKLGGTQAKDAAGVVQAAMNPTSGDPHAAQALDRYIDHFGRALSMVINILDPDAVVLGGGLSNIDSLYERGPAAILKYVFSDELRTPLLRNVHGDDSGVRGAAWLW